MTEINWERFWKKIVRKPKTVSAQGYLGQFIEKVNGVVNYMNSPRPVAPRASLYGFRALISGKTLEKFFDFLPPDSYELRPSGEIEIKMKYVEGKAIPFTLFLWRVEPVGACYQCEVSYLAANQISLDLLSLKTYDVFKTEIEAKEEFLTIIEQVFPGKEIVFRSFKK